MRKETKVEKIEIKTKVYCDVCDEETSTGKSCMGCYRDLCETHSTYSSDIYGFNGWLCHDCHKEVQPFRVKEKKLREETTKLQEEWQKICKEKYGVKQ